MVFRQLFFAQFLEPFRVLGGGQDVDEVACFEDGFRIRDHVLSVSLDIDDDGLFQVWYAGERLVFQNGTACNRYLDDGSLLFRFFVRMRGKGTFQEGIVNRFAVEKLGYDICDGRCKGQRHQVAEVARHFKDEERPGDRGADARREKGDHADDDDIRDIDIRDETHHNHDAALRSTEKRADDKERKEETARHAAAVADQRENIFPYEKKENHGERVRIFSELVDEEIASAEDIRQGKAQKAGGKKRKGDLHEVVPENGEIIELTDVEKSPVKEDAGKPGCNRKDDDVAQMVGRDGDEVGAIRSISQFLLWMPRSS